MTFAWYGHLKYKGSALWIVILVSWGIAFLEYCFQVPANRIGHQVYNVVQLKTIQEDREVNGNYITTYGFADETGKVVIPCKYDYAGNFKDGLAMVGVDISEKFL